MRNESLFQAQPAVGALRRLAGGLGVPDEIVVADGAIWVRGYRFPEAQIIHYVDRIDSRGPSLDTWSVTGAKGSFKVKVEKERSDVFEQLPRRIQQSKEVRNGWPQAVRHPVWAPDVAGRWAATSDPPGTPDLKAWQDWTEAQNKRGLQQLEGVMTSYDRMVATRESVARKVGDFPLPPVPQFQGDKPWAAAWQTFDSRRKEWTEWIEEARGAAELQQQVEDAAAQWGRMLGVDASGFLPALRAPPAGPDRTKFIVYATNLRAVKRVPDLLAAVETAVSATKKIGLAPGVPDLLERLRVFEGPDAAAQIANAIRDARSIPELASAVQAIVNACTEWNLARMNLPATCHLPSIVESIAPARLVSSSASLDPDVLRANAAQIRKLATTAARTYSEGRTANGVALTYQGARFPGPPDFDLSSETNLSSLSATWSSDLEYWALATREWAKETAQQQKRWDGVVDKLADATPPTDDPIDGCWQPPRTQELAREPMTEARLSEAELEASAWQDRVRARKALRSDHRRLADAVESGEFPHDPIPQLDLPSASHAVAMAYMETRSMAIDAVVAALPNIATLWEAHAQLPRELHGVALPAPPVFAVTLEESSADATVAAWKESLGRWKDAIDGLAPTAQSWNDARKSCEAALGELTSPPAVLSSIELATPTWERLEDEISRIELVTRAVHAWDSALKQFGDWKVVGATLKRAGVQMQDVEAPDQALSDLEQALKAWSSYSTQLEDTNARLDTLAKEAGIAGIDQQVLEPPKARLVVTAKTLKLTPDRETWIKSAKQWAKDQRAWQGLQAELAKVREVSDAAAVAKLCTTLLETRDAVTPRPKWEKEVTAWSDVALTVERLHAALRRLSATDTALPTWNPGSKASSEPYRALVRAWVAENAATLALNSARNRVGEILAKREAAREAWQMEEVPWRPLDLPWQEIAADLVRYANWSGIGALASTLRRVVGEELALRQAVAAAAPQIATRRQSILELHHRLDNSHAWRQALQEAEPPAGCDPAAYIASARALADLAQLAENVSSELKAVEREGPELQSCARILETPNAYTTWQPDAWSVARDRDLAGLKRVHKRIQAARAQLLAHAEANRPALLTAASRYQQGIQAVEGTGLPDIVVARLKENAASALDALADPTKGVANYLEVRLAGEAQVERLWAILEMEQMQFNRRVAVALMEAHAARRVDHARQMVEHAVASRSLPEAGPSRLELQRALSQAVFPKDIDRTILVRIGRSILNQDRKDVVHEAV